MNSVLTLLLSHQGAPALEKVLNLWRSVTPTENVLLAYGGTRESFSKISFEQKLFVEDPRLRTADHQREYQSYSGVLHEGYQWLRNHPKFEYIHFVEFDHLPLAKELNNLLVERLVQEDADLLAHHVHRVDGTSYAHYLYHAANPAFHRWLASITMRDDAAVVLSMLGTGTLWTRDCFEAVASRPEPFPMYFEIYLPTLAHHLGFRVRSWGDQSRFVSNLSAPHITIEAARKSGGWTVHPIKNLPTADAAIT